MEGGSQKYQKTLKNTFPTIFIEISAGGAPMDLWESPSQGSPYVACGYPQTPGAKPTPPPPCCQLLVPTHKCSRHRQLQ